MLDRQKKEFEPVQRKLAALDHAVLSEQLQDKLRQARQDIAGYQSGLPAASMAAEKARTDGLLTTLQTALKSLQ